MSESLLEEGKPEGEAPVSEANAAAPAPEGGERPEWLPEKYKTPEDLAKAYQSLESKLGKKDEELREQVTQELTAKQLEGRPETAGDYQLPEIIDAAEAVDNELLKWWSEHSFENGYDQDKFEEGIALYAKAMESNQPDLQAEAAKLGENASSRINAASMFAQKVFPEESMPAIHRMFESADGIIAMEALMEKMKDGSFSADSSPVREGGKDELHEMMRDERYWNTSKRDPAFVKQVDAGFKKLYG